MLPSRLFEIFLLGLSNLRRNKLRSFLTMLGMIFGVGSVIAMLSVGAGARHEILSSIGELGVNNIIVNSVRPPDEKKGQNERTWIDRYGLTFDDERAIRAICPAIERVLPVNAIKQRVWHGSRRVEAAVLGVKPEHLKLFQLDVGRGRPFNHIDEATEAKVCVVRKSLLRELGAMRDPLGLQVQIGAYPFEIVGILADEEFRSHTRAAMAIDDRAHEVYIPYSTSMRTLGTVTFIQRGGSEERSLVELDQLILIAKEADLVFPASRVVRAMLGHLHKKKDYEIVIPLELLQQRETVQRNFTFAMVAIAAISLVVGGIGIANIMLATITERTREIGVRRALGATRGDILMQFLTETAAIGVVGGLLGWPLGLAMTTLISHLFGWPAIVAPHYVALSLAISCVVAILSGIYPARRAAALDPITALRYE